jgi:hypothetical protein
MDMRDAEILQVKTVVRLLGGMRDEVETRPIIKCPSAGYGILPAEREAEKA